MSVQIIEVQHHPKKLSFIERVYSCLEENGYTMSGYYSFAGENGGEGWTLREESENHKYLLHKKKRVLWWRFYKEIADVEIHNNSIIFFVSTCDKDNVIELARILEEKFKKIEIKVMISE